MIIRLLATAGVGLLVAVASAQTISPSLFYADLESGPKVGGENNNGVFVTLYGNNFGTSPSVSVGGGSAIIKMAPASYLWYQKMVIQLGPNAATGNIVVSTAGGDSNGLPFTVRSGNIYFVATTGSDTAAGSITAPWRTIQHALDSMSAGDATYVRDGVNENAARAYSATIVWSAEGTAGNPVSLIAYPGATATITNSSQDYGIRCNSGYSTSNCQYSTLAGMKIVSSGTFAVGIMYGSVSNWRVIGNDISCPTGNGQDGCFHASQGGPWYFYGNYIHDNATGAGNSSKQYHSVYFTTDSNHIWVGWNKWSNNKTCRALQFHSSPTGSGCGNGFNQYDIHVFDNVIDGDRCNGINFATVDPSKGVVEAYNNLVINTGLGPASTDGDSEAYAALYSPNITNCGTAGSGTISVYNNTFWHNSSQNPFGSTGVIEAVGSNLPMSVRNNIVYSQSGAAYVSKLGGASMTGSNNLWFGNGGTPSGFTADLNADPQFVNTSTKDFHIQSSSPAKDSGATIPSLTTDLGGVSRPQGSASDRGAFEFFQGTVLPPPPTTSRCDLNGDGVVDNGDYQLALSQALGTTPCTNADLNGDGVCNIVDVQRVANAVSGGSCRVGQ